MLRNYFKIAWRNLIRTKGYSLINIGGLTIVSQQGFLILLYVQFELSYDTFHTKADRVYRLVSDIKTPSETRNSFLTSEPMAPTLKENFAEVEQVVRIIPSSLLLRKGDVKFQEERSLFADSHAI
jgi:putative ABC transport system permease protein